MGDGGVAAGDRRGDGGGHVEEDERLNLSDGDAGLDVELREGNLAGDNLADDGEGDDGLVEASSRLIDDKAVTAANGAEEGEEVEQEEERLHLIDWDRRRPSPRHRWPSAATLERNRLRQIPPPPSLVPPLRWCPPHCGRRCPPPARCALSRSSMTWPSPSSSPTVTPKLAAMKDDADGARARRCSAPPPATFVLVVPSSALLSLLRSSSGYLCRCCPLRCQPPALL